MINKKELRKSLAELGLNQNRLAKLLHVTPPTLSYKIKNDSFNYRELEFLKNLFGQEAFINIFFN